MTASPRLLVTAGPSREYIDDIRFLSNASSGRMGIAVATAAQARGLPVRLLLGPVSTPVPDGIEVSRFESARDLDALAEKFWPEVDALVATAAVADYRPSERHPGKRKKGAGDWSLELTRNPDVLERRGAEKGHRVLVGFALEAPEAETAASDGPALKEAHRKLVQKHLDLIILNTAANLASETGDFAWIENDTVSNRGLASPRNFRSVSKLELAEQIVEFIVGSSDAV